MLIKKLNLQEKSWQHNSGLHKFRLCSEQSDWESRQWYDIFLSLYCKLHDFRPHRIPRKLLYHEQSAWEYYYISSNFHLYELFKNCILDSFRSTYIILFSCVIGDNVHISIKKSIEPATFFFFAWFCFCVPYALLNF